MKVANDSILERGSSNAVEHLFTLETNRQAFEILSARLYKDRMAAPIREICSNAADAHVVANNKESFVVHLPNLTEPDFWVRDYGPGLSHEDIFEVYTTYFKSTKTQSNDTIGCMGLGSKSPFAYADNFNVISFFNGTKYIYTCYKTEEGEPAVLPLGQQPTDEPNGLEVRFSVQREDHWHFAQKLRTQLHFFENKPTVIGDPGFAFGTTQYILQTDNYAITSENTYRSLVVMGGISYPISASDIPDLSPLEEKLINWGIHLFVPLGAVTPAPSREELTLPPKTISLIRNLLKTAKKDIIEESRKQLNNAANVWEARKLFGEMKDTVIGRICQFKDTKIEWNNQQISNVIVMSDYPANERPLVENLSFKDKSESSRRGRRRKYSNDPKVTTQGKLRRWDTPMFTAEDVKIIYVNDVDRGGYSIAQYHMEENNHETALMFSTNDTHQVSKKFLASVGCEHLMIPVSTLPKPPRKARTTSRTKSERSTLQQWVNGRLENVEVDIALGGVYVECKYEKVKLRNNFDYPNNGFEQVLQVLKDMGVNDEVYCVRPCDLAKLNKYEWIDITQLIEETLRNRADLFEDACLSKTYDSFDNRLYALNKSTNRLIKDAIGVIRASYEATKNEQIQAFITLNTFKFVYNIEESKDALATVKKAYDTYPLLRAIDSYQYGRFQDSIVEYIELFDANLTSSITAAA